MCYGNQSAQNSLKILIKIWLSSQEVTNDLIEILVCAWMYNSDQMSLKMDMLLAYVVYKNISSRFFSKNKK